SGDVRGESDRHPDDFPVRPRLAAWRGAFRLRLPDQPLALVHRTVRQFRGSGGGGRGKAQAETLRRTRSETVAKLLADQAAKIYSKKPSQLLSRGDLVLIEPGDIIPSDGEVVEAVASTDDSVITGESATVIRESGGRRSAGT